MAPLGDWPSWEAILVSWDSSCGQSHYRLLDGATCRLGLVMRADGRCGCVSDSLQAVGRLSRALRSAGFFVFTFTWAKRPGQCSVGLKRTGEGSTQVLRRTGSLPADCGGAVEHHTDGCLVPSHPRLIL